MLSSRPQGPESATEIIFEPEEISVIQNSARWQKAKLSSIKSDWYTLIPTPALKEIDKFIATVNSKNTAVVTLLTSNPAHPKILSDLVAVYLTDSTYIEPSHASVARDLKIGLDKAFVYMLEDQNFVDESKFSSVEVYQPIERAAYESVYFKPEF